MTDQHKNRISAPTPIGDVVPGDPPVPITVWRVTRPQSGETMSNGLGVRLVHNFTHLGDLVIDLTDGPQLARAIIAAGRRSYPQPPATRRIKEQAALVVTGWTGPSDTAAEMVAWCATLLRPGGCLAMVLGRTEPTAPADIIGAARGAGLSYLQHIVAATGVTTPSSHLDRHGRHLRVHTDVLVLIRSTDTSEDNR